MSKSFLRAAVPAACILAACSVAVWTPETSLPAGGVASDSLQAPLKVHLRSGEMVVLSAVGQSSTALTGWGRLYDTRRRLVREGADTIPLDSVALLESSTPSAAYPLGLTAMALWTTAVGAVTVTCVADPKTCFGSCPTFYADGADSAAPAAEGFSASIARVLEARDVDALFDARPHGRTFALTMRNEALETHAVRWVRLLAAPRPVGGRVVASADGRFLSATAFTPPSRCVASEGDCTEAVRGLDRRERRSLADSTDLAARETMELEFPAAEGHLGLVLAARQSLVSTFVFYQALAYMGRRGGEIFAAIERGDGALLEGLSRGMELLNGIDVAVEDGDAWRPLGRFAETGPIATDVQVVPLGEWRRAGAPVRVRLTLARGGWRTDWVALVRLGAPVEPVRLDPVAVSRRGVPDSVALRDPDRHLVTYPGDAYRIEFRLPEGLADPELFLDTRGYYYEWMRGSWLSEENPVLLAEAQRAPEALLRRLAPAFKRIEPDMERLFWSSRFGR